MYFIHFVVVTRVWHENKYYFCRFFLLCIFCLFASRSLFAKNEVLYKRSCGRRVKRATKHNRPNGIDTRSSFLLLSTPLILVASTPAAFGCSCMFAYDIVLCFVGHVGVWITALNHPQFGSFSVIFFFANGQGSLMRNPGIMKERSVLK